MPTWTSENLNTLAVETGFDVCRVTSVAEAWAASDRLREFVSSGYHGQMGWMEETLERRVHPRAMWEGARSAVVLGLNYGPDHDPLSVLEQKSQAAISVYAKGKDYHDVLKKRLKRFARAFAEATGEEVKVFVDTAPLMEKPLAGQAGVGWQGKHTNLVSREFGSWLFLGVMLTTAELEPDQSEVDHCGSCRACLDICPTRAFPAPYKLDARRCISYLTIEHDGPIPVEFRAAMGNRIYGCDDCLAVCPWNKFASQASEAKFAASDMTAAPELSDLVGLDDEAFRQAYSGSPIKRIKRHRFVRNVLIAIGNSDDQSLLPHVVDRLDDEMAVVRGAAVWALRRLSPERFTQERERRQTEEADGEVQREWDRTESA
ncbi:MAG: tRNA epoxyqueuosine(34) reductase QueG [Ponticaulis sp.]|nr:tRNA epoxyqueuosine(34) reductase QueG [Ponticaulis sp.]